MSFEEESGLLNARPEITPLPRFQLFILLLMRVSEPISFTVIFPFINKMLEEIADIPPAQVGYYAGAVESCFAAAQFCTVYFWGSLSDRLGRKTVSVCGLLGVFCSVSVFGFARSFPAMIAARCIAGAMNGNIAVVKSMIAEITDRTNQARAFSFLPITWAIGSTIGPLLGGYLSHPAEQYPNIFGGITFLKAYPYFLPCFFAAFFNLCAIIIGIFHLEETLPSNMRKEKNQKQLQQPIPSTSYGTTATPSIGNIVEAELSNAAKKQTLAIFTPQIIEILISWFAMAILNSSYQALVPLFCYSPYEDGGLAFSVNTIGIVLSINGISSLLVQTFVFPPLEHRLGPARTYRTVTLFLPFAFLALPVAHAVIPLGQPVVWLVLCLMALSKTISTMAAVCNNLLINNSAPSRDSLGRLNGVSQACSSLARSFGPAGATALFALSAEKRFLGGQLVYVVLISLSILTFIIASRLKDVKEASWRKTT